MSFILNILDARIKKYGTQIYTFGTFGFINYFTSIIYNITNHNHIEENYIRGLAMLMCIGLLFYKKWPNNWKKYLSLYWYITIIISLPVVGIIFLINNNFSLPYLINFNIGIMITILLVDLVSFLAVQAIGIIVPFTIYYLNNLVNISDITENQYLGIFLYMIIFTLLPGIIFVRNKEIYQNQALEIKNELNLELEEKVKQRTQNLEEALAIKTEFLNNISHEIRTPVQGFTVISEGLIDRWHEFDEQKRFSLAQTISSNARRLSSLLGGILDLAKFNEGKILLHISNFNINTLIKNIIDEAQTLYLNNKLITFCFEPQLDIYIYADLERIGQLLRNIIVNAIRYQDKGKITITSTVKNDFVNICISDEGVGIPQNELKSIFKSFTQSSRTKTKAGGTGLGLAIAEEIVKAHNGNIYAKNNKIHGATFYINLPLEKINYKSTEKAPEKQKKIIMIDDEISCLLAMEIIVTPTHKLTTFTDQKAALLHLKEYQNIDLIFLDLMMPGLDGIKMLKIIKKEWPNIKIIIQSGTSDQDLINKVYDLGINGFITKPYIKNNILQMIDNI